MLRFLTSLGMTKSWYLDRKGACKARSLSYPNSKSTVIPNEVKNLSKFSFCLGLFVFSSSLFAQQNKDTAVIKHNILLIPFKPTMLMSEIDKDVNASTNLTYNQITAAFRYRLDLALYAAFRQSYSTESVLQEEKKMDTTLAYIYTSIGYNYDLVPGQDSSGESHSEFNSKLQKKHFINNGQLQVPIDYSKRFMNVTIANPHLLPYLSKKYGADIFVFVNEVDIKNVSNPTEDLTQSNFRREVIVQYSIVNIHHYYLAKGVLTTYFPYNENTPKAIGETSFTEIAQAMVKELVTGLQKYQTVKAEKTTVKQKR